jgi:hypothetical protein
MAVTSIMKSFLRIALTFLLLYIPLGSISWIIELTGITTNLPVFTAITTILIALITHFLDSKAKEWFDENFVNNILAYWEDSPYIYNITGYVEFEGEISSSKIAEIIEHHIVTKGKSLSWHSKISNLLIFTVNRPGVTISIANSSTEEEDEDTGLTEVNSTLTVTTLDPIVINYRQKIILSEYVMLITDLSTRLQTHCTGPSIHPKLFITVNRLQSKTAPHKLYPPKSSGVSRGNAMISRDQYALQVSTQDYSSLETNLYHDLARLQPIP